MLFLNFFFLEEEILKSFLEDDLLLLSADLPAGDGPSKALFELPSMFGVPAVVLAPSIIRS